MSCCFYNQHCNHVIILQSEIAITASVISTNQMFRVAMVFNQPIGGWNTASNTNADAKVELVVDTVRPPPPVFAMCRIS